MATLIEEINQALEEVRSIRGMESIAVATRDGLMVTSEKKDELDASSYAAMAATMLGAAETSLTELGKDIPERVIIESGDSRIVVVGAGPTALLLASIGMSSPLGFALVSMDKAARKIEELL